MHFGNSAGNFGGSAIRRPARHDTAAAMSKLVSLLPNYMQIVQNWSEKGVLTYNQRWKTDRFLVPFRPGVLFSVASYLRPGLSP